jgi:predicted acetyltransferase
MSFDYAPVAPEDEGPFRDCVFHALSIPEAHWPKVVERLGVENLRLVREGSRVVCGMGLYRMGLWYGGRVVPCAGVSLVGVSPEDRRRGAARALLSEGIRELAREGEPLAALYASTQVLYRSVGFEQAGSRCVYELPLTSIGIEDRTLAAHRVELTSPAPFVAVATARARGTNGNIERTPGLWDRLFSAPDKPHYGYVLGDPSAPEGYLIYWQESTSPDVPNRLVVRDMAAITPAAVRRLWTLIADHGSITGKVGWAGPSNEPLLVAAAECKHTPVNLLRWMLRIVRVEDALRQRGYPAGVAAELHLDVEDDLLPENSGRVIVNVGEGRATTHRGGRGDLRCNVRGLATLYSGLYSASTLQQIGLLQGTPESIALADRVFAGPEPWMVEIF